MKVFYNFIYVMKSQMKGDISPLLVNRLTFLLKLENQLQQAPESPFAVSITPAFLEKQDIYDFDTVRDTSAIKVDDLVKSQNSRISVS